MKGGKKIKVVFDKLKETLMKRIQQNSIKSELTYIDKEGIEHTETVYLKHGKSKWDNWHSVELPIDEETKKWKVANALFGGKRNLIKLIFYLVIVALFFLSYKEIASQYEVLSNLDCVKICLSSLK